MSDISETRSRVSSAMVLVATIAMIAFNWIAAIGLINGVTPEAVSARYESIITPAGYAFAIWSLIYLGVFAFSIYQILPANIARFRDVRTPYIVSCVLNCAWVYCWHHYLIEACAVIIAALAAVLIMIVARFREPDTFVSSLLTKAPFGIYAGWVTCATLVNFAIMLLHRGVDISDQIWIAIGVGCIVFAGFAAVVVRLRLNNYLYPLAVAWAVTAIAVRQSGNTPIVVAAALVAVTALITAGSIVTKLKDSTSA